MKSQWRRWHRWLAWVLAVPAGWIILTGVFLHLRRIVPWIQPPSVQSSAVGEPSIDIHHAMESVLLSQKISTPTTDLANYPLPGTSASGVNSWSDIKSVEYKPAQGTWSFKTKNNFEIQVDGHNGRVLSVAPRRSLWLMQWHEGSVLGSIGLWGLFFPTGLLLLGLEISGLLMLGFKKRKQKE